MNLEDAFKINISISFSGNPKKKKKKMVDAYESFLRGNLGGLKPKRQGGLVASNWFASQKG